MAVFRFITRAAWCRRLFLALPLWLRQKMARTVHKISQSSRRQEQAKESVDSSSSKPPLMVDDNAVAQLLHKYHARQMIHGHIHSCGEFSVNVDSDADTNDKFVGRRFVVNEWLPTQGNALVVYADGRYEFRNICVED